MRKISKETKNKILRKTPWGHSANPSDEGLNEEQIKGLFYKAITDGENSIISEINRVVDEGNRQFASIDNEEYFGKLDNDALSPTTQNWIRAGNLVYVYGDITLNYTSNDALPISVTNVGLGKNLIFRLTAPDGVVPDGNLTLKVGSTTYSGLSLLRNTATEAENGVYYMRFAIRVNKIRKETVSVKWNKDSDYQTLVFDFNDDYARYLQKKINVVYATSPTGTNSSVNWTKGKNYVGFYFSDQTGWTGEKVWVKFAPSQFFWTSNTVSVSIWGANKQATINLSNVKSTSIVIVEPIYSSYNEWHDAKIRLMSQSNGSLTLICDQPPQGAVTCRVLVGNEVD